MLGNHVYWVCCKGKDWKVLEPDYAKEGVELKASGGFLIYQRDGLLEAKYAVNWENYHEQVLYTWVFILKYYLDEDKDPRVIG